MTTATTVEIDYPSSDGQPMAETGIHVQAIILLHQALEDFFQGRPDVFIASDMFWYWKEGDSTEKTAPDVMVVPGVGNHDRRSYFSWEEGGAVPAVVFEMASKGTWRDDIGAKRRRYQKLGVPEYFIFDPEALYFVPPLVGYRLTQGVYAPIDEVAPDTLDSRLGLFLRGEGTMLRLIDAATELPILTRQEWVDEEKRRADEEKRRADEEKRRADEEKRR
ncbi:MAG: Uma2 family endonuclease, partial [Fimbriiglobus sp.]